MSDAKLLKTGAIGFVLVGLCCFTPILGVLLGALGLSAWLGWLDVVLLPALTFFLTLVVYALLCILRRRSLQRGPAE